MNFRLSDFFNVFSVKIEQSQSLALKKKVKKAMCVSFDLKILL